MYSCILDVFSHLYTCQRVSCGPVESVERHDARDMVYVCYLSQQCTEIARLYRNTKSLNQQIRKKNVSIQHYFTRLG